MKNNSTKQLVYLSVANNGSLIESAITDVSIAARTIGGIDNLGDLSFGDLENISRNLQISNLKTRILERIHRRNQ